MFGLITIPPHPTCICQSTERDADCYPVLDYLTSGSRFQNRGLFKHGIFLNGVTLLMGSFMRIIRGLTAAPVSQMDSLAINTTRFKVTMWKTIHITSYLSPILIGELLPSVGITAIVISRLLVKTRYAWQMCMVYFKWHEMHVHMYLLQI